MATMIAEENKNRVLSEVLFLQHFLRPAHGRIDALAGAIVVRQLLLPVPWQCPQIRWHMGIGKAFGRAFRTHYTSHIVLMMRFELRNEQEERLLLFLA